MRDGAMTMAELDETFRAACAQAPDEPVDVIITLHARHRALTGDQLGLKDARTIPGLDGIICGKLRGRDVLELADHVAVEAIEPDIEATALDCADGRLSKSAL